MGMGRGLERGRRSRRRLMGCELFMEGGKGVFEAWVRMGGCACMMIDQNFGPRGLILKRF